MINSKEIMADFQFIANRVSKSTIEINDIGDKDSKTRISAKFDYNILEIEEQEDKLIGNMEFLTEIRAKVGRRILFKIAVKMEGMFIGNPDKLDKNKFIEMLELNGAATLSQFTRTYIFSISALSGINPAVKIPMINILEMRRRKYEKLDKSNQ